LSGKRNCPDLPRNKAGKCLLNKKSQWEKKGEIYCTGLRGGTAKPREGKQQRCPAGGEKRKVFEVKFRSDDK